MSEETKSGANLVDEFKSKFGAHPVRIERFKITQSSRIEKTTLEIKEQQSSLDQKMAEFISLIFEFLVSEDLYQSDVFTFIDDFKLIAQYLGHPLDHSLEEELISKVVTPFIQALKFQTDIYFDLSRWLIQRLGQNWDIELARSYALNDFFKPLMVILIEKFPNVKLSFITAMAWTTLDRYVNKGSQIQQVRLNDKLTQVMDSYPENLIGKNYSFDLAYKYLLKPNWENILSLVHDEVEKLKKNLEIEREIMIKEQQAVQSAQQQQTDPIDEAKSKVSMKIFELFGFNYEINPDKELQIEKALSLLLRRMALKEFGHVAAESIEPLKKGLEEFLWPEIVEHPIIVAKGINVKSKFYDPSYKDPEEVLEEIKNNPAYIETHFKEKFFQKLFSGYRGGADYDTIAKNFVQILKDAKK